METVPISESGPLLQGVLGPLSVIQERTAREMLLGLGERLKAAAQLVRGNVGWLNSGVELHWLPSGQQSFWGCVSAVDSPGQCVDFVVELRPGWYFGECEIESAWTVELTVDIDCQHTPDHGSMHEVHRRTIKVKTVERALAAFAEVVAELESLSAKPLASWSAAGR